MKIAILFILIFLASLFSLTCYSQNVYTLTADSKSKPGVKYGEHIYIKFSASKIFPGTEREVNVYVPSEYNGETPAVVCVFQDRMSYNADTVVSNLIAAKEIPVMILVAASAGKVIGDYDSGSPRENRTYEYDTPSSQFGAFLLNELLPFVETLKTNSGKKIILSKDRNDRMITGCSSGAAGAFNAAWNTNEFSRVYSACGSYTGLRGSFANTTLLHKFETKPIRFFLQGGSDDMWTSFGDWWSANQAMVRAMDFAGYDFSFKLTENAQHCDKDGTVIFPEVMRFLWKGYPGNQPAPMKKTKNSILNQTLIDGQGFELLSTGVAESSKLVTDNDGQVLVSSANKTVVWDNIASDKLLIANKKALSVGSAGELLLYDSARAQLSISRNGKILHTINKKIVAIDAAPLRGGGFYILGNDKKDSRHSIIWHLSADNQLSEKYNEVNTIGAFALSGNNNWLYTFDYSTRRGYSYKVDKHRKDLLMKQEFFFIHIPDQYDGAETTSAVTDDFGRTYLATNAGIQICDYNGRSEGILSLPGNTRPVSLAWGGKDFNWLYVLCRDGKLYRRELNTKSSPPASPMPKIRVGAG